MVVKLPCEVIIQFVLPSMRREIVSYLVNVKGIKQTKAAKLLGITDAAVTQYMQKKRGNYFKFDKKALAKVHKIADDLSAHGDLHGYMNNTCQLCKELRSSMALCSLHKELGIDIANCDICR